jgi:pilus assembly protein FimV
MPAAEMIAAKPAASADNLAADKLYENRSMAKATAARSVVAPGRVEPALAPAVTPPSASAPPRPVSLAAGAAPSRMRVADVEQESAALRRSAAEGYTFRTERAAAAAAIVNRYAAKKLEQAQAADGIRAKEAAVARDEAKDAQPVTVEVTLAASDLPALLEELRRAGAQLVAQPAADMKNIAAPAPASRATSRPARTGYAASPAAPAAAPAASMAAAAQAADVDSAPLFAGATAVTDAPAAASAPATVTVRFTFLPPAP